MWPAMRQSAPVREVGRPNPRWWGNGHAGQIPIQRRELRYGSREFVAASDLARRFSYSPRVLGLLGPVVRDPALLRVLLAVWRLPVVDLQVRRADADAWFGASFGPAAAGNQYFQHLLGYRARNLRINVIESSAT